MWACLDVTTYRDVDLTGREAWIKAMIGHDVQQPDATNST